MTDTAAAPISPSTGTEALQTAPASSPTLPSVDAGSSPTVPVETPVAQVAPAVEAAPAPASPTETLIAASAPVEPAKQDNAAPVEGTQTESAPVEQPAPAEVPLPSYEAFTLPEGFVADTDLMKNFSDKLAKFEVSSKADHKAMQEFGQELINEYTANMEKAAKGFADSQKSAWDDIQKGWNTTLQADTELGGANLEKTKQNINRVIGRFGGTQQEIAEFKQFVDETGLGNHPTLVRYFSRMGSFLSEGKMVPAVKPVPSTPAKGPERFYGKQK